MKKIQDDDVPRHVKRAIKHKKYGIQRWSKWYNGWYPCDWYVTEKARDQALHTLQKNQSHYFKILGLKRKFRKVER